MEQDVTQLDTDSDIKLAEAVETASLDDTALSPVATIIETGISTTPPDPVSSSTFTERIAETAYSLLSLVDRLPDLSAKQDAILEKIREVNRTYSENMTPLSAALNSITTEIELAESAKKRLAKFAEDFTNV